MAYRKLFTELEIGNVDRFFVVEGAFIKFCHTFMNNIREKSFCFKEYLALLKLVQDTKTYIFAKTFSNFK